MDTFECPDCDKKVEVSDDSFILECPHCAATSFSCPICNQPLKGNQGIHSHFTFTAPRSEHTAHKEEEVKERIQQWKEDHWSEPSKRNEDEIQAKWIRENESEYVDILTEVSVGNTQKHGSYRKIDIVAIPRFLDKASPPFNDNSYFKGEKILQDIGMKSESHPPEDRLQMYINRHQGEELDVEVYEVKKKLNPKAVGQVLVYTDHLPTQYNVNIEQKGIIRGREYQIGSLCKSTTERFNISIIDS